MLAEQGWIEYQECEPAECARRLHEDEVDLACIPLAECLAHGGYEILPFGISSNGLVKSVSLYAKEPIENLDTILFDSASQTSILLLRLLLAEAIPATAKTIKYFRSDREDIPKKIRGSVGGLIIGDVKLKDKLEFPVHLDLGELWREQTGLPFVFAVWASKKGRLSKTVAQKLCQLFQTAAENREVFAREWAEKNTFPRDAAAAYVANHIQYQIGTRELVGIEEFQTQANAAGLLAGTMNGVDIMDPSLPRVPLPHETSLYSPSLDSLLEEAASGERISIKDGIQLATEASLADLGIAADLRRKNLHPKNEVSYIVDRNINYTNICNVYCRFCAFYRAPGRKDGYTLSKEALGKKIQETIDAGGIQILLQGGLNPELGIEYYEDLFRWIKDTYPINLHALSADEIIHISRVSHLDFEQVLSRLIQAGMDTLPGAGAEILVDRIRHRIARLKTPAAEWLDVHRTMHKLGRTSTCTMMFGVGETWEDRLIHMHKLRQLQDETGGFTAFITWPFQEENTQLKATDTSSPEYLRVQSIARLFLDNIPNIQSSWVTLGPSLGQAALFYGANDFGSVMFEENVVSAAGTIYCMDAPLIERHVTEAGFHPFRRNVHYEHLRSE